MSRLAILFASAAFALVLGFSQPVSACPGHNHDHGAPAAECKCKEGGKCDCGNCSCSKGGAACNCAKGDKCTCGQNCDCKK